MIIQDLILLFGGFMVGASLGSFLGCAIYRVPRGISLIKGRSACPACHHTLTPVELIPVASYAIQGGKCRNCGIRLPPAYFWAELSCGIIGLLATVVILYS